MARDLHSLDSKDSIKRALSASNPLSAEGAMRSQEFRSNWGRMRSCIRHHWPDISERDLDRIDGRPERLYRAIIQKNGVSRDEAARQLWDFLQSIGRCQADTACLERNRNAAEWPADRMT